MQLLARQSRGVCLYIAPREGEHCFDCTACVFFKGMMI